VSLSEELPVYKASYDLLLMIFQLSKNFQITSEVDENLGGLGKKLHSIQDNYEDVMKKLSTGKGNLITSVEKIKKLRAKTTKSHPQGMADMADETEETEVPI
jgi:DNA recombination protein RmuC